LNAALWLGTGAAKYRRAAKCSGFGCCSRKAVKRRRSAGESYTCDSSPGEDAAAGENVNAARLGCSAAPTAPRGDGRVSGAGPSRVGRLAVNVMSLVKASKINIVPVSHGR